MKWLKRIILLVMALIMVFGVISLFLPDTSHVERSTTINAPAAKIFPYVNNLKAFNEWSPWTDIDPSTQYKFTGPETGVGAKVDWASEHNEVGKGSQEIIESRANEFVKTRLEFGGGGPAEAQFILSPAGSATQITWAFDTNLNNPIEKYFGLMMDKWVGQAYEKGLGQLKTLIESK